MGWPEAVFGSIMVACITVFFCIITTAYIISRNVKD
jgi:hypothetical protein